MMLSFWLFMILLVITFALIMVLTRPDPTARAINERVAALRSDSTGGPVIDGGVPEFLKNTKLSHMPWLDSLLQKSNFAHDLRLLLTQAESTWSVGSVLLSCGVLGLMAFCIARFWIGDLIPDIVLAAVCTAFPIIMLRAKRARRLKRFNQGLPDALELMTRALRAGHSISAAVEIVAEEGTEPLRGEFQEVYKQQNFGLPNRDALLQLACRVPSPDLRFVVTAVLVQKETGGNLVDILERTATVLRDRQRIQGEVGIYTAQGRLTGWILSLLPVVMFILISFSNPGYTSVLLHDPVGRKLMYIGVCMMALGAMLIRKIVNIKV